MASNFACVYLASTAKKGVHKKQIIFFLNHHDGEEDGSLLERLDDPERDEAGDLDDSEEVNT